MTALRATACPLPTSPPWHAGALPDDALVLLRQRRARYPGCRRLADDGVCSLCLRDVVSWRLPEPVKAAS
jgi:hypothetical protein